MCIDEQCWACYFKNVTNMSVKYVCIQVHWYVCKVYAYVSSYILCIFVQTCTVHAQAVKTNFTLGQ